MQMDMKNKIQPAMACRYINDEWAQYIVPLRFMFFGRGLIYHARCFQDRFSCCLAAPDEIIIYTKNQFPFSKGVEDLIFTVPSFRLCHNYSVNYLLPFMLIFYSNIGIDR